MNQKLMYKDNVSNKILENTNPLLLLGLWLWRQIFYGVSNMESFRWQSYMSSDFALKEKNLCSTKKMEELCIPLIKFYL